MPVTALTCLDSFSVNECSAIRKTPEVLPHAIHCGQRVTECDRMVSVLVSMARIAPRTDWLRPVQSQTAVWIATAVQVPAHAGERRAKEADLVQPLARKRFAKHIQHAV